MAGRESGDAFGFGRKRDKEPDPVAVGADGDMTELMAGAHQLHELYETWVGVGFEPYVAMWLIGAVLKGLPMPDWLVARLKDLEEGGA